MYMCTSSVWRGNGARASEVLRAQGLERASHGQCRSYQTS